MSVDFKSKFKIGQEYRRSLIHDEFGGSRMSGICPSREHPYIFIFSGSQGAKHGYEDGWQEDSTFSYTGHGQKGDMKFTSGNRQLRDHMDTGKSVFLFEYTHKAHVKFSAELILRDYNFFTGPDSEGKERRAIKFHFKKVGEAYPEPPSLTPLEAQEPASDYKSKSTPEDTEKMRIVATRVGHGAFKRRLLVRWNNQCAVTGISTPELLVASHIIPWKDSSHEERLDVNNGLILSPTLDSLFDRHLISFNDEGKIMLSEMLDLSQLKRLGVTGKELIKGLNERNLAYLKQHRSQLKKVELF